MIDSPKMLPKRMREMGSLSKNLFYVTQTSISMRALFRMTMGCCCIIKIAISGIFLPVPKVSSSIGRKGVWSIFCSWHISSETLRKFPKIGYTGVTNSAPCFLQYQQPLTNILCLKTKKSKARMPSKILPTSVAQHANEHRAVSLTPVELYTDSMMVASIIIIQVRDPRF